MPQPQMAPGLAPPMQPQLPLEGPPLILPQNLKGLPEYYQDLTNNKFNWRWIDNGDGNNLRAVTIERVEAIFPVINSAVYVTPDILQRADPEKYSHLGSSLFNWRWFNTTNAGERGVVTLEMDGAENEPEVSATPP